MRTYNEYYQFGLDDELDWKSKEKDEWWRKEEYKNDLELKGEYLETITPLSEEEKNDSPLFKNHTNVKNSEWSILFGMLGQALVDWCVENGKQENLCRVYSRFDRRAARLQPGEPAQAAA